MKSHPQKDADLLSHPFFKAVGCPASGNGAQVYIQQLIRSLEACQLLEIGTSTVEWLKEVRRLAKSVVSDLKQASQSPQPADLLLFPWGQVNECISVRSKVKSQTTRHLDALLGLMLLEAAVGSRSLTGDALQGLKMCYQALAGKQLHDNWMLISMPIILDRPQLNQMLEVLTHTPVRTFASIVLGYLDRPMPTPVGTRQPSSVSSFQDLDTDEPTNTAKVKAEVESATSQEGHVSYEEEVDASVGPFKLGDSITEWHLKRAGYASRNNRLGFDCWQVLSIKQVCNITTKLVPLLADTSSPWHLAAILATSSLVSSTPGHVLLCAHVNQDGDFNIDLNGRCFSWRMEMILGKANAPKISIQLPDALSDALIGISKGKDADEVRHFCDLFGVKFGSQSWAGLLRKTHDLLMELGDPTFPAFPGRWANSLSRVYLSTTQSDLMACVCTLDIALTSQAALHYFHPAELDIRNAVGAVYKQLGLRSTNATGEANATRGIPSDQQLQVGFQKMEERAVDLLSQVCRKRTDLMSSLLAFNELTRLAAASCVFTVGGRGSRIEEVTHGATNCNQECWWLEDKKVEHESSSRLLPKTKQARHWLHRLFIARQAIAERLAVCLPRDLAARWKEVASGLLRFETPVFECIDYRSGKVVKTPVLAGDVEDVTQHYFCECRNFMRHVLITHWAIDGEDRHLLRLVTGHATAGLAVPAVGAMYTPQSAVQAAGVVLERLLQKWLPPIDSSHSEPKLYQFVALPGRRILKVHQAHREHIEKWEAPVFSRWHLAANRIVGRIRDLLLTGHGPQHPLASLWLHLVCFDAIHESFDLESIFANVRAGFELGSTGWVVKITRPGVKHQVVMSTQTPTCLLLSKIYQADIPEPIEYSKIVEVAGAWVGNVTPDCWGGGKEVSTASAFLACSQLWADWCLPPATQLCYSPNSNSPLLDSFSNADLFGLEGAHRSDICAVAPRASNQQDLFSTFYTVINRLGSPRLKLGEQKKRSQLFERWVSLSKVPARGELACTLILVVMTNVGRIKAGKKNAIEWSSQSTYLSSLRPYLSQFRSEDLEHFDALDWFEFCTDLLKFANADEKQTVTASEAAEWFIGCLREQGYQLPTHEAMAQVKRQPVATRVSVIADITQAQIDTAAALLGSLPANSVKKARLRIALSLLSKLPLRWGEIAAATTGDVTKNGELCITSHGFARLKSYSSRRKLTISEDDLFQVSSLLDQLAELKILGTLEEVLLGSKTLTDGEVALDSSWISQSITWAMQLQSRNPNFRIHSLRAHVVSNMLCPGWRKFVASPYLDGTGPRGVAELFRYQEARAWVTDRTRLVSGHSSVRTTLSYYFHAWNPVRSLALRATLLKKRPTEYLLEQLDLSKAALIKASSRHPKYQQDPWEYVQCKVAEPLRQIKSTDQNRGFASMHEPAQSTGLTSIGNTEKNVQVPKAAERGLDASMKSSQLVHVQYLGLRMLGLEQREVSNSLHDLQPGDIDFLESRLAMSTFKSDALRGRIKGDIAGRALNADVRLLQSDQAFRLIPILARMPVDHLHSLLHLIVLKQQVVNWEHEIFSIDPWLSESDICLEVVSDVQAVEPELNLQLSKLRSVIVGSPAHDIGPFPRIYIQPKSPLGRSSVSKARWTTLVRVLCNVLCLIKFPEI